MKSWAGMDEFVAVANAGSFAGGAKTLGTSTSRISRVIFDFEQKLQAQVFDRTTRTVKLTDTGRAILEQCRRILAERDDILASVASAGEPSGELRVTCSTAMGERFIAPLLRRYALRYPELSITMDLTNRIVDLVGEGYDLGIRTGQMPDSNLIRTRVGGRRLLTCASPAYLERHAPIATLGDLKSHQCLIGTANTWHYRDGEADVDFKPNGRWRCNSGHAVVEAAIAGMGVCQLPEFYVLPHLHDQSLILLLEEYQPAEEPIWAVYPQRRHLLPKVRVAVNIIRRELAGVLYVY